MMQVTLTYYGDVHELEMSKSPNVQINGLTTLAPITFGQPKARCATTSTQEFDATLK